ncbi:CLUMA_CG016520, isoform A [Clunio marinus]|uniref:Phosphodiesterase n=1 Tax=Clunio marinus TaxID=568069 RepID=A0A1J1IU98_9DIPT|nr:CLUMA_CG016520, isoform A [Clunio marinus]
MREESTPAICADVPISKHASITERDRPLIDALISEENTLSPKKRHICNGRFLTMHKRRRKKLQTRSLAFEPAVLDDILHGQVTCILRQVGNWRFNAFTLETVTGGRSLPVICVHLFHLYGLLDHFNLDVVRLWKLFSLIEEGYHSTNPYHNSIHATDVTQAMHCFLQEKKILEHLSPLEIMASLLGAVCHDLDHPGVNQPFLIATSNHLAALYENTSVLENHHWRSAIGCLLESGVAEQIADIRPELEKQISSLILATDITRQQEFIGTFKDFLNNNTLNMRNADHRHFILQIALKCADISNPCRPWDVSKKWSLKVCEEFFRQGDFERQLNLPVTSLCDRQTTTVPKIQTGFFKFVVTPLMVEWHRFLKTELSYRMMRHLKNNEKQWDTRLQAEIAEETRTEISDAEIIEDEFDDDVGNDEEDDDGRMRFAGSPEMILPEIKSSRRSSLQIPTYSLKDRERRLSVPLHNVPKIILPPREHGGMRQQIEPFLESDENEHNNKLEQDSLSILSSDSESGQRARSSIDSNENERPLSAENLLPDLNIASMTDSYCADKLNIVMHGSTNFPPHMLCTTSKHLIRQQTFPPLNPYVRTRYMSSTADLGTCPEALLESRSSSSSDSPDNSNGIYPKKDLKRETEHDIEKMTAACKWPKIFVAGPNQKENLDPAIIRKGSTNRRRGSAPISVATPSKSYEQDNNNPMSSLQVKTSEKVRRCSVPAETITLSAKDFVGPSDKSSTHSVISSVASCQRRGSVPCESNVVVRSSVNGKRRNPKKLLRRRSSGGAETFTTPIMTESIVTSSTSDSSVWNRFKKELSRRKDSDVSVTRRRGSLPIEVLTIGLGTLRH